MNRFPRTGNTVFKTFRSLCLTIGRDPKWHAYGVRSCLLRYHHFVFKIEPSDLLCSLVDYKPFAFGKVPEDVNSFTKLKGYKVYWEPSLSPEEKRENLPVLRGRAKLFLLDIVPLLEMIADAQPLAVPSA